MNLIALRALRLLLFGLIVSAALLAATLIWPPRSDLTSLGAAAPAQAALAGIQKQERPGFKYFGPLRRSQMFSERKEASARPPATGERQVASLAGFRLIGLMSGAAKNSFAVVENTTTGRQELVGVGDMVGAGQVVEVGPDRIVVQLRQGRTELVLTEDAARQLKGILSVREPDARKSEDEDGQVRELEDGQVRELEDGRRGLEVVEPGMVGERIGLEPGDIVIFPAPNLVKMILSGKLKRGVPVLVVRRGDQTIRLRQQADEAGQPNGREPVVRQ